MKHSTSDWWKWGDFVLNPTIARAIPRLAPWVDMEEIRAVAHEMVKEFRKNLSSFYSGDDADYVRLRLTNYFNFQSPVLPLYFPLPDSVDEILYNKYDEHTQDGQWFASVLQVRKFFFHRNCWASADQWAACL